MGAERAAQIAEMENMGFERSQIELAMRAAFFNSERAIEYLLTVSFLCLLSSTCANCFRVSQKISSTRPDLPLRRRPLLPRLLPTPRAVTNQLICLRRRPRLALADVELLLVELELQLELEGILLEVLQLEALQQVAWETWTSCEIIRNSNNSDRSYNRTLKCWSLSCNRSALGIHNSLSSSDNIPNSSYNFSARMETMMRHYLRELKPSVSPRKSVRRLRE